MALTVPTLDADTDVLTAALAYAKSGWYVGPAKRGSKHPGSVLNDHWQAKTSRDPEVIVSWFAGTEHGVFLHCGRSGAVVFDVDHPDEVPLQLVDAINTAHPPRQSTRTGEARRGHYIFAVPEGRSLGNGAGRLGKRWGEVRGTNGIIIVAPSIHEKATEGGRYEWLQTGEVPVLPELVASLLPDQQEAEDAATDAEVRRFLDACSVGDRMELLATIEEKFTTETAEGGSRHDAGVTHVCWAMREARAGCYPARVAGKRLQQLFIDATTTRRRPEDRVLTAAEAKSEFAGITAWAIAQAGMPDLEDLRRNIGSRTGGSRAGEDASSRSNPPLDDFDDDGDNPPPAADPAMFRGVLGECVQFVEPHTEADPVGILVTLMSKVGVITGPGVHLMIGPTRHPLLIWPILFGRSGTGAKGEAESAAALIVTRAWPESKEFTSGGMSTGEGLIERIKDPPSEKAEEDGAKPFRQPAGGVGTEDKRLIITEEEFATVLARSSRETNTLGMVMRLAWAGGRLSVMNRSAYVASSSHIGIVAHITPREFRVRRKEADMAGGTLNRYLPFWVERSKSLPVPPPIDDKELTAISWKLHDAIKAAQKITRLSMNRAATELWTAELYEEFRGGLAEDTAASDFTKRAAPYCLRLAGLYAALDGRHLIDADDLIAAAALVRYSVKTARHVLDATPRDPRLDRLRRALDSSPTGLTKTEISALFSRKLKSEVLEELLKQLLELGPYEQAEQATGGRPAVRYRRRVDAMPGAA